MITEFCRIFGIALLTITTLIIGSMLPIHKNIRRNIYTVLEDRKAELLEKTIKQMHLLTTHTNALQKELDYETQSNQKMNEEIQKLSKKIKEMEYHINNILPDKNK